MCGIAGFSWRDELLVKSMREALCHRGPDDEGLFVDDDFSLGHRRLSIVDLSPLGRQRMLYKRDARRVVATFDGGDLQLP